MSAQIKTFKIFTGPMWSSKTTHLLMELEKCKYQKRSCALFKPKIDDRYSSSEVVSHAGWKWPAISVTSGDEIVDYIAQSQDDYDTIAVDEAFMLPRVGKLLIFLFRNGYNIVVSSLEMSSQLNVFEEVGCMFPWATHLVKLTAPCAVCFSEGARYTYKKSSDTLAIAVGGTELYEARCADCHPFFHVE